MIVARLAERILVHDNQRIGHDRILECPVLAWTDQPGSKISVFREFPQVVRDLLCIRAKKRQATTESSRWP